VIPPWSVIVDPGQEKVLIVDFFLAQSYDASNLFYDADYLKFYFNSAFGDTEYNNWLVERIANSEGDTKWHNLLVEMRGKKIKNASVVHNKSVGRR